MSVPNPTRWAGVASVAAALAAQWLLRLLDPASPFAPHAAGNRFIRHTPVEVSNFFIQRLGGDTKPLLAALLIGGALAIGYAIGARRAVLLGGLAATLSFGAMLADPVPVAGSQALIASAVAGLAALAVALAGQRLPETVRAPSWIGGAGGPARERGADGIADPARRRLLHLGVAGGGALVLAAVLGTWRFVRDRTEQITTAAFQIAGVSEHDPAFFEIHGLSPLVTANEDHYVISISFAPPSLNERSWSLPIHGEVGHVTTFTLADLRAMESAEHPVLMCCISNPIGGPYVGNAYWTGVPLRTLLAQADVLPSAVQVLATSYDGYTETLDLDVMEREEVLVVYAMNGEPLPRDNGYPARLLHIGRFGMRSVKWLSDLELIPDRRLGYWEQRGWDQEAIMSAASRIDTPPHGASVGGAFILSGVAWAGARGVSAVEVSVDSGRTWLPAQVERELGPYTWRRWQRRVELPPGYRSPRVRVTERDGTVQEARRSDVFPAGARGHSSISVTVVDPALEPPTAPPTPTEPPLGPDTWPTD